jgi:thiamine-monophosphate kinase
MPLKEFALIDWIRSQSRFDEDVVLVGPGDDCAVVACGGEPLLIGADQVLDGVHFRLDEHGPLAGGRKAMLRNLSDLAGMAAEPLAATATVCLPRDADSDTAEAIYRGLREAGDAHGCPLVGGDVAAWDHPLAISVTVLGRPGGIEPVLRSGARAGDVVCVTGRLGGAWRTRRHLEFTPRIAEARALAEAVELHAMIDLSDGLSSDLRHICRASRRSAEIDAADVPVHADAPDLAAAMNDGEDYELLFTCAKEDAERIAGDALLACGVTAIGWMRDPAGGDGMAFLHETDGTTHPLEPGGWEHG